MREGRQRPATVYRYIPKRPVENGTPHESDGDDIVELSRQGEREDALRRADPIRAHLFFPADPLRAGITDVYRK